MPEGVKTEINHIEKLTFARVAIFFKSVVKCKFPLLAFLIPFVVRFTPEILMWPYVVGFDPLGYYVPYVLTWLKDGVNFWPFLGSAPFLYTILIGAVSLGAPIVLLLKILAPLLLGTLGIAIYFYASKTLSWSPKKSLIAVLLATLYFVALRVSWDMFRSELALVFFFISLVFLEKDDRPYLNWIILSIAMLSVVFAHQLVAVLLFAIILITLVRSYIGKQMNRFQRLLICSIPAFALFITIVLVDVTLSGYPVISGFSQDSPTINGFLGFASYPDLLVNTLSFIVFCYLPLMPLLLLGYKRFKNNLHVKIWIGLLLILIFVSLISTFFFFGVLPYRFILLLTYPLSFIATAAFTSLKKNKYKICAILILATFSVCFVILPAEPQFVYYSFFPTYVPRSMLMNTVPLSDCQDTENALQWTKNNMTSNSRLLTHIAFYGWALLSLDSSKIIPYEFDTPETVVQELLRNGSLCQYYLIWWVNKSDWFGQPALSSDFIQIYQSGRIAVFAYFSDSEINSELIT
jgi:hypothetical protein